MQKKYLYAATMAAMLASCSSDDLSLQQSTQSTGEVENAISFEGYTRRNLSTRSGSAGILDNDKLAKSKEQGGGFGVFAYQTFTDLYDGTQEPKFMFNQGVFKNGDNWEYSPVSYWSNSYGSDAKSDEVHQFSFFAYAPYVDCDVKTGKVADISYGITGFNRNTEKGDPIVKYVSSFKPSECVDLCWGVCADADKEWKIIQNAGTQTMEAGLPWLNVQHPQKAVGQKLKFTFQHALAQLNAQIDVDADLEDHQDGSAIAEGTKVYVRSITFSGLAQKGALNLNNTDSCVAKWAGYNCCTEDITAEDITIFDGRKDEKEGVVGAVARNEKVLGLNPTIISDDGNTTEGVTGTLKNLFDAASADSAVMVIPTGEPMSVTIVYDVETADEKVAGYLSDGKTHGKINPQVITKEVKFGEATALENGKRYTLRIHIGLTSVQFDAEVSDWKDTEAEADVWMPSIVAKGVSLNKSTLLLAPNEEEPLAAIVMPSDAVDKTVTWTSSDETVAKVEDGKVTALATGVATITATNSTGQSAICVITVPAPNTLALAGTNDVGRWVDEFGNILDSADGAAGWIAYISERGHGLLLAMKNSMTDVYFPVALKYKPQNDPNLPQIICLGISGSWRLPSLHRIDAGVYYGDYPLMQPALAANPDTQPLREGVKYWSGTNWGNNRAGVYVAGDYHLCSGDTHYTLQADGTPGYGCSVRACFAF